MKGFIEVTKNGDKVSLNVNKIVSFEQPDSISYISLDSNSNNTGYMSVRESYEEIKQLIVEATK